MSTQPTSLDILNSVAAQRSQQPAQSGPSSLDVLNAVASGQTPPTIQLQVDAEQQARIQDAKAALEKVGGIPKGRTTPTPYIPGRGYDPSRPIPKPIQYAIEATPFLTGAGEITEAGMAGYTALTAPRAIAATVGTGLVDSTGREITREAVRYGPSLLKQAATSPLARKAATWVAGKAMEGAGLGLMFKVLGLFK